MYILVEYVEHWDYTRTFVHALAHHPKPLIELAEYYAPEGTEFDWSMAANDCVGDYVDENNATHTWHVEKINPIDTE